MVKQFCLGKVSLGKSDILEIVLGQMESWVAVSKKSIVTTKKVILVLNKTNLNKKLSNIEAD